jgi:hypothetical protein
LFSYVSIEDRVPASHPLLRTRQLANLALIRPKPTLLLLYASEGLRWVPLESLEWTDLGTALDGEHSAEKESPFKPEFRSPL